MIDKEQIEWSRMMCDEFTIELSDRLTCVNKAHPEQIINISMACQGCPYSSRND